jgi:transposase
LIGGSGDAAMMGRQQRDQARLFYEFRLEDRIPENHLLRRMNVFVTAALADLHEELEPYYSAIGRPSIDPELMIRMLIVGYCYGIRSERKLCQEVELHLAYRWFCRLDLDDKVPHHSTFSENRLGRFRESDLLRRIFERVVWAAMAMGLVKGEGFAVDASVLEANASRYHGKAPDELDWTDKQRQARAVAEYLAALDEVAEPDPNRKEPKVISPSDPSSAWTAKANKRVQFGYGLNYLIDIDNAVIVDVEATPARTYDDVAATKTMARPHRGLLRPEAEAAGRRHGLRYGQVPGLAREGEADHAAHPGVGAPQARGRQILHFGFPLGRPTRHLHLPQRQAAQNQRNGALRRETALPRPQERLRCVPAARSVRHEECAAPHRPRRPRGRARRGAAQDEDQGVSQVAISASASRCALRT